MTLAIFDLDNTLLDGDSEWLWSQFLAEHGIVGQDFIGQIVRFYQDYESGKLDIVAYQKVFLEPLVLMTGESLLSMRERYLEEIQARFRPWMLNRLASHRAEGHRVLLITATNSFLAEPIADLLKIDDLICTQLEMVDGKPSGMLQGIPAFREGKVKRLETWLVNNQETLSGSWAYSDSRNDLPLLQQATRPVAVTPDEFLEAYALKCKWEILR